MESKKTTTAQEPQQQHSSSSLTDQIDELSVVSRVRKRLLRTSLSRLPPVLDNLVPRLLRRIDRNATVALKSHPTLHQKQQEIQHELVACITYCRNRLQSYPEVFFPANDKNTACGTPWIDALLHDFVETWTSPVTFTLGVALLQSASVGLHRTHIPGILSCLGRVEQEFQSMKKRSSCREQWYSALTWILLDCLVGNVYGVPIVHQNQDTSSVEEDQQWNTAPMRKTLKGTARVLSRGQHSSCFRDALFTLALDLLMFPSQGASSLVGIGRFQHRSAWDENPAQQQQIIAIVYREAVGSLDDPGVLHGSDRGLLLSVLAANDVQYQFPKEKSTSCSLPLAVAMMILVVGHRATDRILQTANSHNEKGQLAIQQQQQVPHAILGNVGSDTAFWRNPLVGAHRTRAIDFLLDSFHPLEHDDNLYLFLDLVWSFSFTDTVFSKCIPLVERAYRALDKGANPSRTQRFQEKASSTTIQSILNCLPDHPGRLDHAITGNHDDHAARLDRPRFDDGGGGIVEETMHLPVIYRRHSAITSTHGTKRRENTINTFREHRKFQQTIDFRRAAYDLLALMVANEDTKTTEKQNIVPVLLACASVECDAVQPHLVRTLQVLARARHPTTAQNRKHHDVAALLPSMVAVACSPSSSARHALSLSWIRDFIAYDDPLAALHILTHLREDHDVSVAAAAAQTMAEILAKHTKPMGPKHDDAKIAPGPVHLDRSKDIDMHALKGELLYRIQRISKRYELDNDGALLLLIDTHYSEAKLASKLERRCLAEALAQSGVFRTSLDNPALRAVSCDICFDEKVEGYSCPANDSHTFCCNCWNDYLDFGLEESTQSNIMRVSCPRSNCSARLPPTFLRSISPEFGRLWEAMVFKHFLEASDEVALCPDEKCPGVAVLVSGETSSSHPVTCFTCHAQYCFQCGGGIHRPASCESYKKWTLHVVTSSFWVRMNSKPCPQCSTPIEKNAGCNHMCCTCCGTNFCWLCLSVLESHLASHTCNRYQEGSTEEHRAKFFAQRYHVHKEAQTVESKRKGSFDDFAFLKDEDVETIESAFVVLLDARDYLANSYIAAWEMSAGQDNRLELFSAAQATLEMLTERLSRSTEAKRTSSRFAHMNGQSNVEFSLRSLAFLTETVSRYKLRLSEICSGRLES